MSRPFDWRYSKFFDITIARLTEENRLLEIQKNLIFQEEQVISQMVENRKRLQQEEKQIIDLEKKNNDVIADAKQHNLPLPIINDYQTTIETREKLLAERIKRQSMYEQWKKNMINTMSKTVGRPKR